MPEPINGIIRPATLEDLPLLRSKLQQEGEDTTDLEKQIVFVIEHNGVIGGVATARLIWYVGNVHLFGEFKRRAPYVTVRRAMFKLVRAIEDWLRIPANNPGPRWYVAHIRKRKMQESATDYGMLPVWRKGKMFVKDIQ